MTDIPFRFRRLILSLGLACLTAAVARSASAQSPAPVSFTPILSRQTLYNYATNPCPEKYFPDGPIRAFRRADGRYVLDNNEQDNWQMVGSSPFSLQVSCPSILSSSQYGLLNRGLTGIGATYTEDGQTIYGLAGQDLSGLDEAIGCDQGTGNCWQADIAAIASTDMGNSFNFVSAGNGDVASLTHTLTITQPSREGYVGSSNIIKRAGFYYLFVYAVDAYANQGRTCLIRTSNLADHTSWRGYDGSGFNAVLQPTGTGPSPIPCVDVGNGNLPGGATSLTFIPRKGIYVAVSQAQLRLAGDTAPVSGAYYSTSADLLNWTPVQRLMALPHFPGVDSMTESDNYPVLIDPFSQTRNFETLDSDTPVLVYTLEHLVQGRGTLDRDLVAVPLLMR